MRFTRYVLLGLVALGLAVVMFFVGSRVSQPFRDELVRLEAPTGEIVENGAVIWRAVDAAGTDYAVTMAANVLGNPGEVLCVRARVEGDVLTAQLAPETQRRTAVPQAEEACADRPAPE